MEEKKRMSVEELNSEIEKLELDLAAQKALTRSKEDEANMYHSMWEKKLNECNERKAMAEAMVKLFDNVVKSWK